MRSASRCAAITAWSDAGIGPASVPGCAMSRASSWAKSGFPPARRIVSGVRLPAEQRVQQPAGVRLAERLASKMDVAFRLPAPQVGPAIEQLGPGGAEDEQRNLPTHARRGGR